MGKKNYPYYEIEISRNFPSGISTHIDWKPSTNIIETSEALIIEMELPGVVKDEVSVTLINNQELIVKGSKRKTRLDDNKVTYYLFEREFGAFYRKIGVEFPLDTAQVRSVLENGVLTIEIPKRQAPKIQVEVK